MSRIINTVLEGIVARLHWSYIGSVLMFVVSSLQLNIINETKNVKRK